MGLLEEIVKHKREEVSAEMRRHSLNSIFNRVTQARVDSLEVIFPKGEINIIGEFKRKSPSGEDFSGKNNIKELTGIYDHYCRAVSVLTDERYFGGSLKDLELFKAQTSKPVLRKDFIVNPYQIYQARLFGADMVLLVSSILNDHELAEFSELAHRYRMHALVEVSCEEEVERALRLEAKLIGINNRDLETQSVDLNKTLNLAKLIPKDKFVISESGIRTRDDVESLMYHVDGFLIGTGILEAKYPGEKLRELTSLS